MFNWMYEITIYILSNILFLTWEQIKIIIK